MATFEWTGPLRLDRQLDGSASQSVDCGVAACVMALDDASYGLIRPSTGAVRKRMGIDRDATNPDQWKAAIDSYADRFASFGLHPPRTSVVRGHGHDEFWRLLHDQRRRVIAALHYGTVASEQRSLWASRSFRGNHAVCERHAGPCGWPRRARFTAASARRTRLRRLRHLARGPAPAGDRVWGPVPLPATTLAESPDYGICAGGCARLTQ